MYDLNCTFVPHHHFSHTVVTATRLYINTVCIQLVSITPPEMWLAEKPWRRWRPEPLWYYHVEVSEQENVQHKVDPEHCKTLCYGKS